MRFQVPQFIEKESKLFGPLTLKQFLWCMGGGVAFVFAQFFVTGTVLIVITIIIALITAFLAFGKVNDMSGPNYILNAIVFFLSSKKFTYHGDEDKKS